MPKRSPKMLKKTPARVKAPAKKGYARLVTAIESANLQMTGRAASLVNQALVIRNWLIGAYIVEYEQGGADRAKYGAKLLERLAKDLSGRRVKGCSQQMLERMRQFYLLYPQVASGIPSSLVTDSVPVLSVPDSVTSGYGIRQPLVGEFQLSAIPDQIRGPAAPEFRASEISSPPVRKSQEMAEAAKSSTLSRKSPNPKSRQTTESNSSPVVRKSDENLPTPLTPDTIRRFSWTQLMEFIRVDDPWKRAFYENECLKGKWSKRQLQRQIESLLYERTGLSKNKKALVERARTASVKETVEDMIRDPYVLEFIGLAEREEYSENELESALLNHLQRFLLELGEGFCFEARQFRITVNNKHDRLDLLFYHRRLRCHVLVDLKIRAFRHTDAGQMNFYLNWFKAHMQAEGDNPPVGIILCSSKDGTEVEFATAGMDSQMFVSRYLVALPSAEQLRKFVEADRARIELATDPV